MAYDEDLAARIRDLVIREAGVAEQRMFGGLAFLVNGNMAIAASGEGGLLVRADPEEADDLLGGEYVRPMEMRGRKMRGWLRVDAAAVSTKDQLEPWVARGVSYARSLPAKAPRR
jgi:TfoX/Sxy family transcriptional regulator of competence genes